MTIFRFSGLLLLALASCRGEDPAGDARRLGLAFCRAVEANEEQSAEALMSPALQAGIARLSSADAAFRKAQRQSRSPLAGDLKLAAEPIADDTDCRAVAVSDYIKVEYTPNNGYATSAWTDRLLLERGPDGRLLIGDIIYNQKDTQRFSSWIAKNSGNAP